MKIVFILTMLSSSWAFASEINEAQYMTEQECIDRTSANCNRLHSILIPYGQDDMSLACTDEDFRRLMQTCMVSKKKLSNRGRMAPNPDRTIPAENIREELEPRIELIPRDKN